MRVETHIYKRNSVFQTIDPCFFIMYNAATNSSRRLIGGRDEQNRRKNEKAV